MKKIIITFFLATLTLISCKKDQKKVEVKEATEVEKAPVVEGNVNVSTSLIEWKGTKPTGFHNGTVSISTGSLNIENDKVIGGDFTIDMNSIVCLDIPTSEEGNQKLVGHLKSADFFDVEKFPTVKFVIAEVNRDNEKFNITGNLTIKDVTKSITFPAILTKTDKGYNLTSESFKIDRTQFGVTYKSKTIDAALKDKFIDDLMEFVIKIESKN